MKKITEQWLKSAKDDLEAVNRLISEEHLAHIVAFHCQQCIEKSL
ncbi:HEPN domain-containing protein [Desulfonema limicola]|uniref:HEPN domain-containing protein n=1 Tax=Desulfonema limicola TaxID=45656 RepID=A0A975BD23_9BACT|nr:HEPN domain-containing protein [Desulfonema limicola]QTA83272.1 HEPN domain-containing protein [Desulfonema limicola]